MQEAATLQDIIERVDQAPDLTPARRREIKADLRRLVKILRPDGRADLIQAVPRVIRSKLEAIEPAAHGLKPKRWANFKSNVSTAFKRVGAGKTAYYYAKNLPPVWRELLDRMSDEDLKYRKLLVTRIARVAAFEGLDPCEVRSSFLQDLLDHYLNETLDEDPRTRARNCAVTWNWCLANLDDWPGAEIVLPKREVLAVKLEACPKSFQEEVCEYVDMLENPSRYLSSLKYRVPERARAANTIELRNRALRQAVGFLVALGTPIEEIASIAHVVAPPRLEKIAAEMNRREIERLKRLMDDGSSDGRTHERSSSVHTILKTLRSVALDCYNPDQVARRKLGFIVNNARVLEFEHRGLRVRREMRTSGLTEPYREKLKILVKPDVVAQLRTLPGTLYSEVRAELKARCEMLESGELRAGSEIITRRMALNMRSAIALGTLLRSPIRDGDLVALNIIEHLRQSSRADYPKSWDFLAQKTGMQIEIPLDQKYLSALEFYLKKCHPVLTGGKGSEWLFPGADPVHPIDLSRFAHGLSTLIEKRLGVWFNMHLLRHLIAKLILLEDPSKIGNVVIALGHTSDKTARQNYCDNQTADAVIVVDEAFGEARLKAAIDARKGRDYF